MKKSVLVLISICSLPAALVLPLVSSAQTTASPNQTAQHHHYKLVDIGTLGGPNSNLSGPLLQVLNNQGTFATIANTPNPNPNASCFVAFNLSDCFVEH